MLQITDSHCIKKISSRIRLLLFLFVLFNGPRQTHSRCTILFRGTLFTESIHCLQHLSKVEKDSTLDHPFTGMLQAIPLDLCAAVLQRPRGDGLYVRMHLGDAVPTLDTLHGVI